MSMKTVANTPLSVLAYGALLVLGAMGGTVCIGSDGHVGLKFVSPSCSDCCGSGCGSADSCATVSDGHDEDSVCQHDGCGCVDVPLNAELISSESRSARESPSLNPAACADPLVDVVRDACRVRPYANLANPISQAIDLKHTVVIVV